MVRRRRAMTMVTALIMGAGYKAAPARRQDIYRHSGLVH